MLRPLCRTSCCGGIKSWARNLCWMSSHHDCKESTSIGTRTLAACSKPLAASKVRPADVDSVRIVPSEVTDVFLDFDGTLTLSNMHSLDYIVAVLREIPGGTRVCDSVDSSPSADIITWEQLDTMMASCVHRAQLDFSETSFLGTAALRAEVQDALHALHAQGVRIHVLTMGTPCTHKALLQAAGYDTSIFSDFLGCYHMARNQELATLFNNGSEDGFEFTVKQDLDDLDALRRTGNSGMVIQRIMTMDKRLSKPALIAARAGRGGLLVDDNWQCNVYEMRVTGGMYAHVDPVGVASTARILSQLASEVAGLGCPRAENRGRE